PPRRVTLSTVGLLPALERLTHEPLMPNLAISLHAPTDAKREALVPINKKYGIADIIDACKRFPLKKRARITFEYVLLAGVNDATHPSRFLAAPRRWRRSPSALPSGCATPRPESSPLSNCR